MPLQTVDQPKVILPVFSVEVTCSRQWGDAQQNHLDSLVTWSARLTPDLGLKLVEQIRRLVTETLAGALTPISESGARAMEALGKDKFLSLPAGELTHDTTGK